MHLTRSLAVSIALLAVAIVNALPVGPSSVASEEPGKTLEKRCKIKPNKLHMVTEVSAPGTWK
ncbi:hypothetical protein ACRALDRAFT_1065588 [Sodiomyces alcalophilus JCM 7366]|uniref:uncharacterized protein n=1 Tax=Sodiomyces alcalophilus JCM 7366 TaxID=591952 RepID=UPI0039B5DBE9